MSITIHGFPATEFAGTCTALEVIPAQDLRFVVCGDGRGRGIHVSGLPAGRRDVTVPPLCAEHGGINEGRRVAALSWAVRVAATPAAMVVE